MWVAGTSVARLSGTISSGSSCGSVLSFCAPRDCLLRGVVCRGSSAPNCGDPCNSRSTFSCNWLRSYAARNVLFSRHLGVTWTATDCVFLTFCFSCPSSPFSSSVPFSSLSCPTTIRSCWRMTHYQRTTCSSWTSSSSSPSLTLSMIASPILLAGSHAWRSLFLAQFPISSLVLTVNFGLVSPHP